MKTRDKILKVAENEFAKLGYDAVSMNALVDKLEINKATIYYHFKDKKSLYHEIIKNAMGKALKNIEVIFDESKDSNTLFRDYVNAVVLTIKENPCIVPIALREIANFGGNVDDSFIPDLEKEIYYLTTIVENLDLKDEYKNMNMYSLFSFIQGTIKTFYSIQMSELPIGGEDELKLNGEKSLDYISEFISNIILDAITKN